MVCAVGWLLGRYQELLSLITFSFVTPRSQKHIVSAAACSCGSGSTEPGRFHRTCLWTAVFNDALIWILEDPVVKMIIIQTLQMLLWTFHSHAQAILHVLCRQGEMISKETFCAFLDDILLLPNHFLVCLYFFLLHHILIPSLLPSETDGELVILMSSLLPREGRLKCFVFWELTGWAPSLRM